MAGYSTAAEGPSALPETSRALARGNRRILAERRHWPDGAVEVCERLEDKHPGWEVNWMAEWQTAAHSFDREPGFYAWRCGEDPLRNGVARRELYGAGPEALEAAIKEALNRPDHP